MASYKLIHQNSKYSYFVDQHGKLVRKSKNTVKELGYIEDNMGLYKRLCESI